MDVKGARKIMHEECWKSLIDILSLFQKDSGLNSCQYIQIIVWWNNEMILYNTSRVAQFNCSNDVIICLTSDKSSVNILKSLFYWTRSSLWAYAIQPWPSTDAETTTTMDITVGINTWKFSTFDSSKIHLHWINQYVAQESWTHRTLLFWVANCK